MPKALFIQYGILFSANFLFLYSDATIYIEMIAGMRKLEQQPSYIENCNIT